MENLVKLNWQTHGFKPEDIPEEEWDKITEEYMKLRNEYTRFVNGPKGYEQFNADFDAMYPTIDNVGYQNVDGYVYGSYLAWRLNDAIRAKMKNSNFMKSDILEPFIFMDGNIPDIGMQLKNHDGCTIDFTLAIV